MSTDVDANQISLVIERLSEQNESKDQLIVEMRNKIADLESQLSSMKEKSVLLQSELDASNILLKATISVDLASENLPSPKKSEVGPEESEFDKLDPVDTTTVRFHLGYQLNFFTFSSFIPA